MYFLKYKRQEGSRGRNTSTRKSGIFDSSRLLSTGGVMNSSMIEKYQPSYQGKDPELFKSGSDLS